MSLLPFLMVAVGGAVLAFLVRGRGPLSSTIGGLALVGAFVAALAIRPGEVLLIGGSGIATTEYLRLFLVLGSLVGLVLAVVGAATMTHRDAPTVTLGILATSALAMALPDPRLAVLAATAGGAFGALLALAAAGARAGATVGIGVLRMTVIAGTMAIAAMAWIGRDLSELAAQPIVFGLAYLAVAVAVAIRFGAIPFHRSAARLTDTTPETTLPLVTAWGPAAFAVVALAWADASVAPLLLDLDSVRVVVLAIAVASIVLATIAAWVQDDIEHVVGYSIIGDAGVVLLAVAALDPEAWAPARMWILALVVARSAFAVWAAATRATFATGRVDELRGWAIKAPPLAVALAAIVLASISLPGLAAFEARASLVDLALGEPLGLLVLLATLSPLAYYGRLGAIGMSRSAPDRERDGTWRPTVDAPDLTRPGAWIRRTWDLNGGPAAVLGALLVAVLAVVVSVGGFGAPAAAAGLPPTLDGGVESFDPDGPVPEGSEAPPEPTEAPPAAQPTP
jgi:NADH:ubiquinone oxidoreductase subunit 2 (subunit N)